MQKCMRPIKQDQNYYYYYYCFCIYFRFKSIFKCKYTLKPLFSAENQCINICSSVASGPILVQLSTKKSKYFKSPYFAAKVSINCPLWAKRQILQVAESAASDLFCGSGHHKAAVLAVMLAPPLL